MAEDTFRLFIEDPDAPGVHHHELTVRSGAALIVLERQRQVQEEGYDADHDLREGEVKLQRAAEAYLAMASGFPREAHYRWPWDPTAFKPSDDAVRMLVKAGALIAAAIDVHLARYGVAITRTAVEGYLVDPGLTIEDAIETASDGGEL